MSEYDNTNSGVIFKPHEDQKFVGQGKLNVEGNDSKYVLIREKLSASGDPQMVLYKRAGVLFKNDKNDNEKAPDFSGPLDDQPDYRVAGWKGEKDGRSYISLRASLKQTRDSDDGGVNSGSDDSDGWDSGEDEIPF